MDKTTISTDTDLGASFGVLLAKWYAAHKRDLPWRHTQDPYLIWLSEIILQQTRVAQGLPYYQKFVAAYPTVITLAAASEEEVLRLWQGLGYYSRARNMHLTARIIVQQYGGQFPRNYASLLKLKGIGPYTAAAIASFAFNEPVAVVDGNVFRVLARLLGIHENISSPKGKQTFSQHAQQLLQASMPDVEPATFNQAIMEFGAIHCTAVAPACKQCIFQQQCYAYRYQAQQQLPVKAKKMKVRKRRFLYFIFQYQDKILVKQRGSGDIWQGLYDFPTIVADEPMPPQYYLLHAIYQQIERFMPLHQLAAGIQLPQYPLQITSISAPFKHQLTHQLLQIQFVQLTVLAADLWEQLCYLPQMQVVTTSQLEHLPKPVLLANYLQEQFF